MLRLEVDGLACRRGGRVLFTDLTFTAQAGDLVCVRGANGSGKTSLLRLIVGLGLPEAGEVRWSGSSLHSDVAWIGHVEGMKLDLTPRENLEFHRALVSGSRDVAAALEACGLTSEADTPCRELSAGQRRRSALARLLVSDAPLWILDEPLTALDVEGQEMVQDMIAEHGKKGGIAVVTSHQAFRGLIPKLELSL